MSEWPASRDALVDEQHRIAEVEPEPWEPPSGGFSVAACFVCFPRGQSGPGAEGDPAVATAVLVRGRAAAARAIARGRAGAPYEPGLLALREGRLLASAVRALPQRPGVLLVDATGRDHPRRAGLALQLGAVLDLPTVGVTHRPLCATGGWPDDRQGARSPLVLDGSVVGYWVRTRQGTRPLAAHAAWRTDPELAAHVVLACTGGVRTPLPLREARRLARTRRAAALAEGAFRGIGEVMAFTLASEAFGDGQRIPRGHTCEGADVSPPLTWTQPPEGAQSLALVVDDPDAPGGTFTHWLAWGIEPDRGGLAEGERPPLAGRNDFGVVGYRGPCPPRGHGPHRYVFTLYALAPGAHPAAGARRPELEEALRDRVLAEAVLTGTYER